MHTAIDKLSGIFKEMVSNADTFGSIWKNVELGKEAFSIFKTLPDCIPEEFSSPQEKAEILATMLEQMEETYSPRFCIEVRNYIKELAPDNSDNISELRMLHDYIDMDFPMEEFCKKYHRHLKFDPVERTEKMERVIVDVERECAEILKDMPRGMGFCFMYWSTRREILARYGIDWKSPGSMNPRVMFD